MDVGAVPAGNLVLVAPTDDAFEALATSLDTTFADIAADKELVFSTIAQHVAFEKEGVYTTLAGTPLDFGKVAVADLMAGDKVDDAEIEGVVACPGQTALVSNKVLVAKAAEEMPAMAPAPAAEMAEEMATDAAATVADKAEEAAATVAEVVSSAGKAAVAGAAVLAVALLA